MKFTRRDALAAGAVLASGLLLPAAANAGAAASLAPILGWSDWLAARPAAESLRGRVVLVDVFTFGCYNCKNITPNLRTLHRTKPASDLTIVGVHTPETPYERERAQVVQNLRELGITWPVAIDNDYRLWKAYGIEYWPTQLIFDRAGNLRRTIVGDSQDELVDRTIAQLVSEGTRRA